MPAFMTLLANFLTCSASHYRRITGLTLIFMITSWDHVSFQVLQKNRTDKIIYHLYIHLSMLLSLRAIYREMYYKKLATTNMKTGKNSAKSEETMSSLSLKPLLEKLSCFEPKARRLL